jgi:hypothetical protein
MRLYIKNFHPEKFQWINYPLKNQLFLNTTYFVQINKVVFRKRTNC